MIPPFLQNPIVEYVFEFLLKQALQHGPDIARKARGWAKRSLAKPVYLPRVGLIDRESELRTIQTTLEEVPHLRILYFVGEGGVGKTRLLEYAEHFINSRKTRSPLRWGGLLDLYHTELHSVSTLQVAIVQGLDPAGEFYQRFRSAQDRFNRLLTEGLTGQALEAERQKVNDLFFEEYRTFAQNYRPVVAFDTLESLTHESDWVESLCNLEGESIAIREWLIEQVRSLDNSVILMAGRPQPAFKYALERANKDHHGQLEIIELKGLTREDTRQLLTLLLRKAPSSLKSLMEQADYLWQITKGLPVQLALAVDLASHGEFMFQNGVEDEESTESWGQRLVNTLFPHDNPSKRILFLLGLARKGMTDDLLHYLEPERSKADCHQQLEQLRITSIVKTRPEHEDIFLHDALYELFDQYAPPRAILGPWYERLAQYYRAKHLSSEPDNNSRSQTSINLLYYELQQTPRHAFESVYMRLRETALKGHELELDLQLRDELLRFIRNPATDRYRTDQKLTQAEIDRDGAVRWIKRYLIQSHYQQAILIAETILALGPKPYSAILSKPIGWKAGLSLEQEKHAREILSTTEPLFWGQLLTYYCEALIYLSAPESKIYQILEQAATLLESVQLGIDHSLNWLRERVLGRVNDRLGYLFRTNGHYGNALIAYQNALPEFKDLDIADEAAATLNNLALILALLGDSEQAKAHADQALELRQRLGQKYPLALSYNTRGRIYALRGQYDLGQKESQLALSIFEELETPRGVGLACNALGYILRKQGENWKPGQSSPIQAIQSFQQSIGYLERAAKIFSEKVSEPIRLWEAYNEQGSLFREWGFLHDQQRETEAAQKLHTKAVECQLRALEVAQRYKMRFQEADTYDDLAKISQDQGDTRKAKHWLKQALSMVPKEFRLITDERHKDTPRHGEAFWLILGKAHWQEGAWVLQAIAKGTSSERKHQEYARNIIENFTLAAYCFEQYWPGTSAGHARLHSMADQILGLILPVREAKKAINEVSIRYNIEVSAFLQIFTTRSVKTIAPGVSHE